MTPAPLSDMALETIIALVIEEGAVNATRPVADEIIARSAGRVTWAHAGETWAILVPAEPGVTYPPIW